MEEPRRAYLPAAGHDRFLPLYDPLLRLLGVESTKRELVDQAAIRPSHRVLDLGCGTGTLAIWIKRRHPDAEVVGVDPDPKALSRGRRKAERADVAVRFVQGFAHGLPYAEASFDRVLSSFMFHHLEPDEKRSTLDEVRRILRPAGSFHLLDFGGAEARADSLFARVLHSTKHLRGHFEGRLSGLITEMGFESDEVAERSTIVGRVVYYRATLERSGAEEA